LSSKEVSEAKTQAAAFRAIKEPKKEGTPEAGAPHADTSNDAALHETMDDITRGLLKSAERGVAIAQYLLAGRYRYGEGVDKNYELAAKWYEKAANQGNVEAQFSLGSLYYLGEGVTKDYTQAEKWLRKAAENGNDVSQYHLGNLYWEGKGVTKNQDEAIKWYMEAAKQGNDRAKTKLNNLHMPQSDPEKRSSAR
jgi:TPR repeat protein